MWWGVSPKVWLPETLGHAWGLDDFFWRGLAWVARKPFVMKAMPPFATMRFDDSGGLAGLWWMLGHAAAQKTPFPAELHRIIDLKRAGAASVLSEFEYVAGPGRGAVGGHRRGDRVARDAVRVPPTLAGELVRRDAVDESRAGRCLDFESLVGEEV